MRFFFNKLRWNLLAPTIFFNLYTNTPGRRQSKTLLTIDERGSKIAKKSVFDCHLSPVGLQMSIENSVSNDFYLRSSILLTFPIAAYPVWLSRLKTLVPKVAGAWEI